MLLEVLRHRRVVADRREQLHVGVGHLEQRLLDAVALDDLAVLDLARRTCRGSTSIAASRSLTAMATWSISVSMTRHDRGSLVDALRRGGGTA